MTNTPVRMTTSPRLKDPLFSALLAHGSRQRPDVLARLVVQPRWVASRSILAHPLDLARRGDDAVRARVTEDPLEQSLSPSGDAVRLEAREALARRRMAHEIP